MHLCRIIGLSFMAYRHLGPMKKQHHLVQLKHIFTIFNFYCELIMQKFPEQGSCFWSNISEVEP